MKTLIQVARQQVTLGAALLIVGCSATTASKTADNAAPVNKAGPVDKADALAATALQLHFKDKATPQALKLLQKATKEAPLRPELLWLNFELCAQALDCSTEATERRLLELDPDNGALQLGALARALRDEDRATETAVLESISTSRTFQVYWNTLISKLASAASRSEKRSQPVTRSLNDISDWYAQLSTPTFGPLLTACSAERTVGDRTATARCMRIARLLLQSDTYIAEAVGLNLAERLLSGEQSMKITERGNVSRYQRETASGIINAQVDREKLSRQLLDLMARVPREQDVFQTVMRWGGQAVAPLEP